MKEQWTKMLAGFKGFWGKLGKTARMLLTATVGVILLAAVAITISLNMSKAGYVVLYPNITETETMQVYATLKEMDGATPTVNKEGQVMVPSEAKNDLMLQLALKGYPKSAPAYDTFLDNKGFTNTELENKNILLFQLNDRLQATISSIGGVESCVVNIVIPENSTYVWDKQNEESSASVTVGMVDGTELSSDRVTAIKNLVSSSVPKCKPTGVTVIDAKTGIDMQGDEMTGSGTDLKRLDFERTMEKNIEDKIKKILSPIYGINGVTAVATVKLNYDNVKSEQREVIPQDDGNGVKTHLDEQYVVGGQMDLGGIVGEENNTDTPAYAAQQQTPDGQPGIQEYQRNIDWDISTRIIQTESGPAILEEATASVVVMKAGVGEEDGYTDEEKESALAIVSKGVNIPADLISIEYYPDPTVATVTPTEQDTTNPFFNTLSPLLLIIAGGVVFLLLMLTFIIVLLVRKKAKKKVELAEEHAEDLVRNAQQEINAHKRALAEAAQANNTKENAMTNEVRLFAKDNPEITATLIRSLLKEEE